MVNLHIFGMFIVTLTTLSVAFISVRFIVKHFSITIEYLNEKEIDPYVNED